MHQGSHYNMFPRGGDTKTCLRWKHECAQYPKNWMKALSKDMANKTREKLSPRQHHAGS